jgi:hypothetical protein
VHDLVGLARPLPDTAWLHQELKRPGVTLQRLWLEYLDAHPEGYRYSQFCRHYGRWIRTLAPTMCQVHRAGEKAFVDFSGQRPVLCQEHIVAGHVVVDALLEAPTLQRRMRGPVGTVACHRRSGVGVRSGSKSGRAITTPSSARTGK